MPELPAFIAIRTAVGTAEETTQGLRRPLPATERSEAIRKIVDALTRHLSGREVLSKDALVKLVEDLALITGARPSYVGSVLQEAGEKTSYFDLYTSTAHPMNVYSKFFANKLGFKDEAKAGASARDA